MVFWGILFIEFLIIFLTSNQLSKSLAQLIYRVVRSQRVTIMVIAVIFFPGVVIHELAHMIMAGVLFVPIYSIDFLPEVRGDIVKLGSVKVAQSDIFRRFLIGVAPLFVGSALVLILLSFVGQSFSWTELGDPYAVLKYIGILYGVFVVSNTMFSSKKDLEGAIELVIVLIVVVLAVYIFNSQSIYFVLEKMSEQPVVEAVQRISILLLVPLGINIGITGLFAFFAKR